MYHQSDPSNLNQRTDQPTASILSVDNFSVVYGKIIAVHSISLEVPRGEIVVLIGSNGAGKSSTLRAIAGAIPYQGKVTLNGHSITHQEPEKIVQQGLTLVPEGRSIFENLTVLENLKLGGWNSPTRAIMKNDLERVYHFFPRLKERLEQIAGTLSGGEQQMLALGRALMTRAQLLLLDEPSMGLSPILVREIFLILRKINEEGISLLLVEQNANLALRLAHHAYLLELGKITLSGTGEELLNNPKVREGYLGKR